MLVRDGKPKCEQVPKEVPTLRDFAPRFLEGHVRANRHKPSGVAGNESIIRRHLVRRLGSKRLNEITTEDVQQLKAALTTNSPKTVNNVLTVLNVMLRTAVEWNVIDHPSCTIKLVRTTKSAAKFHDFDAFERLVQSAQETDRVASIVVLLGGEAGCAVGK